MMCIGRFQLANHAVLAYRTEAKRIMGRCTVVSASYSHTDGRFNYTAVCDMFRPVDTTQPLPFYYWHFDWQGHMFVTEAPPPQNQTDR